MITAAVGVAVMIAAVLARPRPAARSVARSMGPTTAEGRRRGPRRSALPGVAVAGVLVVMARMVGPMPALGALAMIPLARALAERRTARRARHHIAGAWPNTIEMFVLSVRAGLLPRDAVRALCPAVAPGIGAALTEVIDRFDRGERFAAALSSLPERLGAQALTFADTLAAAERTGLALGPALDRLADEARQHRRRAAEAAARELPVRLSIPLVVCTLPAFALVAVVPLLLGAISSLTMP